MKLKFITRHYVNITERGLPSDYETDSMAPIINFCIIAGQDQEMRAQPVT